MEHQRNTKFQHFIKKLPQTRKTLWVDNHKISLNNSKDNILLALHPNNHPKMKIKLEYML